ERANMTIKPVAREKTRLYFGPYATRLEAEAAAKKVDTNFLRYQILQDDQSSGFIISFGAFADEMRLRAVGRVASSFGLGEGKATPVIHEGYQVVRKTAAEASAHESPSPTLVPGLKFDELFVDETSPTQTGESDPPSALWQDLRWSGYLKNETAYRYHEPRSITKIRNILYLNAQYPLIDNRVDLFFAGWAYHDLAYDLFNYDTIAARSERNDDEPLVFVERLDEEKDSPVADIRELYADLFFDKLDLRVGKQYIVWGVLEGVRVVDEVNPIDFRELIMPDLLDYRIPLWSLKMDYTGESADYQFIWIPDLRFNKPAPRGSEWEMLQDVCIGQAVTILCVNDRPQSWTLQDSEVGIKIDKTWLDTEFTLNYLYTWDDFPVVFRTVRVDSTQVPPAYFPAYTRIQLWGGTAVK
ncbi:MAG: hypothetical protein FD130_1997, partial [Halothiobacillaceae bacterium]